MNLKLRLDTFVWCLIAVSLFYLALPYIIFFVGWLKWYWAIMGVGLTVAPLFLCIRGIGRVQSEEGEPLYEMMPGVYFIVFVLIVAVLWLGISGVGGYGYQDTDWLKHNAVLKDLVERPWPVVYRLGGQQLPLVYYIAYYLPAAGLGKLGGWHLANQALFAWSWIGLILAMTWFLVLTRQFTMRMVWLFVLFSGLDVIGELVARWVILPLRPEAAPLLKWDHIEQWSIGWQYSSNTTLLFWVPHQALAGWIATGMLLYTILYSRRKEYSFFIVGLTALWSPFVTVGLLPYVLVGFLLEGESLPKRLKRYLSLPGLCGLGLLAITGLYYSAKLVSTLPLSGANIPQGFSLSFAPDAEARLIGLGLVLVFCILEFGLYAIFVHRTTRDGDAKVKGVWIATLVCLSLFPFYRFGGVNDFVMRASIPALYVLAVFVGRSLSRRSLTGFRRMTLVALLVIGSITAMIEFRRHASGIYNAGTLVRMPQVNQVMSIDQWRLTTGKDATIILQYVGSSRAPFFELMARQR